MPTNGIVKGYEGLAGAEWFVLAIEAMARGDGVEEGRLDATCPRKVYRTDDRSYRLRVHASFVIAATTLLGMREDLTLLRVATMLPEALPEEGFLPVAVAAEAMRFGRSFGRFESGGDPDHPDGLTKEDADFGRQVAELRDVARQALARTGEAMKAGCGELLASKVLGYWDGFARFCRRGTLEVEPVTLLRAWGLGDGDPTAGVRAASPDARADEAVAAAREAEPADFSRRRRFPEPPEWHGG